MFTCLATRVVHLEITQSLETNASIQSFLRFISRRGKPSEIYSDNGSNFRGAEYEFNEEIEA